MSEIFAFGAGKRPALLFAAPIAGISDRACREIMRCFGADIAVGEMVSARALAYGNQRTQELLDIEGEQGPRMVQISGCDAPYVAEAARLAASLGADIIDLNMGCPAPKVIKNGEGCQLMRQPELAAELVAAARMAGLPVSCKFRSGWDDSSVNAVSFARRMEQAGAAMLTVHARTRQQFYSGKADWRIIAAVKQAVSLPVVGNGDIFSAADARAMLAETDCDHIMVGRGMLGNPWLFRDIRAYLDGREPAGRPEPAQILSTALTHLRRHIEQGVFWYCRREGESTAAKKRGEELAVCAMRAHLGWYSKGLKHGAQLRHDVNRASSYAEVEALFAAYLRQEQ